MVYVHVSSFHEIRVPEFLIDIHGNYYDLNICFWCFMGFHRIADTCALPAEAGYVHVKFFLIDMILFIRNVLKIAIR